MRDVTEYTDDELVEIYESGIELPDAMDELVRRFQRYSIELKSIENDTQRFGE